MTRLSDETDNRRFSRELLFRCIFSFISGAFTQLALLIIPHFFPLLSLLFQLFLSVGVLAIAIVLCQFVRRLFGVHASAPAFVFFHIIFTWVVCLSVISFASDPGFVRHDTPSSVEGPMSEDEQHMEESPSTGTDIIFQNSSEAKSLSSRRMRYCRSCKAYVMGFDHHCPAFGNCIGKKNYGLFMSLLVGFIITEASYAVLSYQWINSNLILKESSSKIQHSLVISTMNFSLVQVLWQVIFFAWHVYCVCVNIRTEEWINWRKYPEFHVIAQTSPDQSLADVRFRNPYNNGVLRNLKEFLLR
ncbi:putative protein S-acyltransferase 23 [Bienertia sinuspersici]